MTEARTISRPRQANVIAATQTGRRLRVRPDALYGSGESETSRAMAKIVPSSGIGRAVHSNST